MGRDPTLMLSGERIIWSGKPKLLSFIMHGNPRRLISGIAGWIFAGYIMFLLRAMDLPIASLVVVSIVPLFSFIVGMFFLWATIKQLFAYGRTQYFITNQRIIMCGSPFGKRTVHANLEKIKNIRVEMSPFDGFFNTGTLVANNSDYAFLVRGGSENSQQILLPIFKFQSLEQPIEAKKALMKAVQDITNINPIAK